MNHHASVEAESETNRPQHFRAMEGKAYQLGSLRLAFKGNEDSKASYTLVESVEPPGASVALHRHPAWQETFIVIEGRFGFEAAGDHYDLGPGETLVIPRGAPHGFACTSEEAGRLLTISSPAHVFEAFVADTAAANSDPAIDVRAVFARHGLELL
jgi:quercetin dioxygenase-like cupin family protein